jgi:hypothetical protein
MRFARGKVIRVLGVSGFFSLSSGAAFGQEAFAGSTWVTVKPGEGPAFEKFWRSVIDAAVQINAPGTVLGYSVDVGSQRGTYVFVRPVHNWAELDSFMTIPAILEKAYGSDEGKRIYERGAAAIASSEVWFFKTLRDLNRPVSPGTQVRLVHLVRTEVEPAMRSVYETYLASVKAAEDKVPQPRGALWRVSVFGPATIYSTEFLFGSWAERDDVLGTEAILAKAYGESVARELTESSSVVSAIGRATSSARGPI